jgi:2-polyprenyl-3-methyl-5-hydroxy-6-metoxy-1,4-benzoquinol methylase
LGVDLVGKPDIKINLEKEGLERFNDNQYDLVMCFEVLEHLDNLHEVFANLLRVSSRRVIISLPNAANYKKLWHILRTGKTGSKQYGLPASKPEDRHKWFFSWQEIIELINKRAELDGYEVEKVVFHYNLGFTYKDNPLLKFKEWIIKQLAQTFNLKGFSENVFIVLRVGD